MTLEQKELNSRKLDITQTVLIAEDEAISRHILRSFLMRLGFKHILEASNGVEAIALGRAHAPRFALLDIYMPEANGWEVAKIFKRELPTTLLIVITSSRDSADTEEAVSVDAYFFKPFQQDALLEKMAYLDQLRPAG